MLDFSFLAAGEDGLTVSHHEGLQKQDTEARTAVGAAMGAGSALAAAAALGRTDGTSLVVAGVGGAVAGAIIGNGFAARALQEKSGWWNDPFAGAR